RSLSKCLLKTCFHIFFNPSFQIARVKALLIYADCVCRALSRLSTLPRPFSYSVNCTYGFHIKGTDWMLDLSRTTDQVRWYRSSCFHRLYMTHISDFKCLETHPVCHRCTRSNSTCGYGIRLTWHEESISRGVCHGRAGVWSKRGETDRGQREGKSRLGVRQTERSTRRTAQMNLSIRDWIFLNVTYDDLKIHLGGIFPRKSRPPRTISEYRSLSPCLGIFPNSGKRSKYDSALMSYFENIICSSSTLVDNAHYNPYRYLILPMALESEGLYHATLAIAANTLRLSDSKYRLPALEHHHHALHHLRELLSHDNWGEKELDEMLGLVLMLCWFDVNIPFLDFAISLLRKSQISDNSRPSWVTHLSGFRDLIRTRQERPGRSIHSQELLGFFNRYFAFHLVLARTAFRVDTSTYSLPMSSESSVEGPDTIDPYMGFSQSLLLLINQVTELAWSKEADQNYINPSTVYRLKRNLENIQQRPPNGQIDPTTECAAIAEANRLEALLLLHETCSTKAASLSKSVLAAFETEERSRFVGQILNLMLEKKVNMMRTAVLPLWPLFLAGCCAREDEERVTVLRLFEEFNGIRRFGNIAPAREVVEMVWRQRDLAAEDEGKRQRGEARPKKDPLRGARFAWEHAMVMLGDWKLSLT
ncbi:hypothetical protein F1880_007132, partial [Penicillium rolfsii]